MPSAVVTPIIDPAIQRLCPRPYPGHPKGCPNYGKKEGCPPGVPALDGVLDLEAGVVAVWSRFLLAAHVRRMRDRHPTWSDRQLRCCLYWQPTARKYLEVEIAGFVENEWGWTTPRIVRCPEAYGVNVTETMAQAGVELEWPPVNWDTLVALVGHQRVRREPV